MLGKYRCNAIGSQVLEFRQSKRKNKTYYLCNQWQCQCLVNDVSAAYRNPIDLLGRCGSSSFLSFLIFLRSFFFLLLLLHLLIFPLIFISIPEMDGWSMHLQRSGRNFLRIRRFIRTGFIPLISLSLSLSLGRWCVVCVHTRAGSIYLDLQAEHHRVVLLLWIYISGLLPGMKRRKRRRKGKKYARTHTHTHTHTQNWT